jgi:hypothetical protein
MDELSNCISEKIRTRRFLWKIGRRSYYRTIYRVPIRNSGKEMWFSIDNDGNIEYYVQDYWASQGDPVVTEYPTFHSLSDAS